MSDEVKVSIELNATRATQGLARFQGDLLETDKIFAKLVKKQGEWAADYSSKLAQARQSLSGFAKAAQALEKQRTSTLSAGFTQNAQKVVNDFKSRLKSTEQALNLHDRQMAESAKAAMKQRVDASNVAARAMIKNALDARNAEKRRIAEMTALQKTYQRSLEANNVTLTKTARLLSLVKAGAKSAFSMSTLRDLGERVFGGSLIDFAIKVKDFMGSSANIASDFLGYQNALQLATGSQKTANQELQNAIGLARALKLDIGVLMKEYSKFANSLSLAGVQQEKARAIFEQFAGAARVLNLSPERTSGMFLALEQMVSKGTVSMEELRRQLGDHLPGALNMAAEAMGYGKDEIRKFMDEIKKGNVVSTELVTKLGELVYMRTKDLVPQSLQKYSANLQAVSTEWTLLKARMGEALAENLFNPVLEGLTAMFRWVNKLLGPMRLLGKEIEYMGLYAEKARIGFGGYSNSVATSSDALAELSDNSRSFNSLMNESEISITNVAGSMAILGTAGAGVTGVIVNLLAKLHRFVMSGLRLLWDGLTKVATAFKSVFSWVAKGVAFVAQLNPWIRAGSLAVGGGLALYAAIKKFTGPEPEQAKKNLEDVADASVKLKNEIENIKNKGITADDLLSKSTTAIVIERMNNLRTAIDAFETQRQAMRAKIQESMQRPQGWFESDDSFVARTHTAVRTLEELNDKIRAARAELLGLQSELITPYSAAEQLGTNISDALDAIFKQGMDKIKPKTLLETIFAKFDEELAKIKKKITVDFGGQGEVDNPEYIAAAAAVERYKVQLREAFAAQEALKGSKKDLKDIFAEELKQLEDIHIKQTQNIANLYLTNQQQEALKAELDNVNRIREYELQLIEQKISKNEYNELVKNSTAIRDLAVQYSLLNEEMRINNERQELINQGIQRANQYIEGLDPGSSIKKQMAEIDQLINRYSDSAFGPMVDNLKRVRESLVKELAIVMEEHRKATDPLYKAWTDLGAIIRESLVNGIAEGRKFIDVLRDMASQIVNTLLKQSLDNLVGKPLEAMFNKGFDMLGSFLLPGFEKGGAFNNKGLVPFAKGGTFTNSVVTEPTRFKFANGTGIMGEAGPEAIMPLKRMPSGSLGVEAKVNNTEQSSNTQQTQRPLNIINVTDPAQVREYLATPDGEDTMLNFIRRNSSVIRQVIV